jgi:pyrroline-5-carboxylate reductase
MKIGVVGTGVIASAVVSGLAGQGHEITVSERSAAKAAELAARFDEVSVADNQTVLDQSDLVFLGLMAEQAGEILGELSFHPDHQVVSLMAGAGLDEVAAMVAPAVAAAVMIPFPGIAQGGSPVMVLGNAGLIADLFAPKGNEVFALRDAAELDAWLCAQAVLSAATRMVRDTADWLAPMASDPEQGERFLRMLVGSSLLASETGALLEALNTPGGYNARLREHMTGQGMTQDLHDGLNILKDG